MSEHKIISDVECFKQYKYVKLFCVDEQKIFAVCDGNVYLFLPTPENELDEAVYAEFIKSLLKDFVTDMDSVYAEARSQRVCLKRDQEKELQEQQAKRLEQEAEQRKQKELEEQKKKSEKIKNKPLPNCVDRAFDLSVINLDCNYPIEKIIDGIINFAEQFKNDKNTVKSCCILLSGNSGTGKSEFAKYIASLTGFGFKHTRASDILNKYVGETEKTITELFRTASSQKNVLLIDEADSLLRDRSLSKNSWEVTQVNEFLCRMEEYQGILICSSNLINNFDKAAMRRFVFKIKFLDLTDQGKETLAKKYFNEVCLLPEDLSEIKTIADLRPGDFKAVRDRMLIVYRDKVSFSEILDELRLETSYRVNENLKATL